MSGKLGWEGVWGQLWKRPRDERIRCLDSVCSHWRRFSASSGVSLQPVSALAEQGPSETF